MKPPDPKSPPQVQEVNNEGQLQEQSRDGKQKEGRSN